MARHSLRQIGSILAIVGLLVGWAIPHFQFLTAAEDLLLLIIIAILVLLVSAVLGRMIPHYDQQVPWAHVFGGTGLFVGGLIIGYLVFGRAPMWLKEWMAILIVLAVLGYLAYHNLPVRRSGGGPS
jgi:hypothetical protein